MGYPAEAHHVTTDDGYILEIHRIPSNQTAANDSNKLPIFMQHGLFSSSSTAVINLNQSLGKYVVHIITEGLHQSFNILSISYFGHFIL